MYRAFAMRKLPWLTRRKKTDPELPLKPPIPFLENYSNGEFLHVQTDRDRLIKRLILERADEKSRRLGIDRRQFLASTMGMATSLSVINLVSGCGDDVPGGAGGSDDGTPGGSGSGSGTGGSGGAGSSGGSGGGYDTTAGMQEDCDESKELLDSDGYFIFDMQTHHVNPEGNWVDNNPNLALAIPLIFAGGSCEEYGMGSPDLRCLGFDRYVDLIFLESDTTMAVLSGYPSSHCSQTDGACGFIVENDEMAMERDAINMAASSQRMINHCNVAPNDGLDFQLDHMQAMVEEYGVIGGWKAYTGWEPEGGEGWFMDDPGTGIPFIEKGIELGVPIFCVHKGPLLPGFTEEFNNASDMGRVARMYPEAKFIVYHSGLGYREGGTGEPYDPEVDAGVNNVINALLDNDLGQNSNLYAEMGSLWANVMMDSMAAQHVIGKLLLHFGDDNVLWGSECIWYVSPQPQIEAFLALQISQEFQDRYGYPELTDERKRKILGLNAAALYGIDPDARRCQIEVGELELLKRGLDEELGPRRWSFQEPLGPTTRRAFVEHIKKQAAKRMPG